LATVSIAAVISAILYGLIIKALEPATSGIEETLEVITGVPQAIASRTGKPKPSQSEGKTTAMA
jgi:hypothetical protein